MTALTSNLRKVFSYHAESFLRNTKKINIITPIAPMATELIAESVEAATAIGVAVGVDVGVKVNVGEGVDVGAAVEVGVAVLVEVAVGVG